MALHVVVLLGLLQHTLLLARRHVVVVSCLLYTCSQLEGLSLPLWHLFLCLLLLDLPVHLSPFSHQFDLLIGHQTLVLSLELLSLLLEDLLAVGFMLLDTVWVEASTTTHSALPKF